MSDNKKALYIYIYPYKFLDFIWDLWELNEFSEFLNIQVWDLSVLLSKKFEKSIVITVPAGSLMFDALFILAIVPPETVQSIVK